MDAGLSEEGGDGSGIRLGQIPDGEDAVIFQDARPGLSDEQKLADRQRPQETLVVFPGNDGGGIGLFVIGAHLGEGFVEGYAYGDGHTDLLPDTAPKLVGDLLSGAEQMAAAGHVEKALVDAESLHQIGVALIDGVDAFTDGFVLLMMGGDQQKIGALLFGAVNGLGGLDVIGLG